MRELEPEMTNSSAAPVVEVRTRLLRLRSKNGVAASTSAITGCARPASPLIPRGASRKGVRNRGSWFRSIGSAEYAVFRVKNRQVLIGHYLELSGIYPPRQFGNLRAV